MKLRIVFSLLTFTLLSSCNEASDQKQNIDSSTGVNKMVDTSLTFENYSKVIPSVKLPMNIKCENELKGSMLNLSREVINKYGYENASVYGKFAETDKFVAIIYLYPADVLLPIIQTNDKNGNKISELKMYEKWCGGDEFSWGTSWADISNDHKIILSDSAIIYKRDNEGQIIEKSKTSEVRHRQFSIDETGLIVEK